MSFIKNPERVLVLAPHTDDGEFGCGGTIARLVEDGVQVYYVAFSSCDESVPKHLPKDILKTEMIEATTRLGIPTENKILFNFRVRHFAETRQAILEEMVKLQRDLSPNLVFLPTVNDTHQDHHVVAQEGFRAFKRSSMFAYELPWNNLTFTSSGFIELEARHLEQKASALECYKSQVGRPYASAEYVTALAITRGVQAGVKYAECFEVVRNIIRA